MLVFPLHQNLKLTKKAYNKQILPINRKYKIMKNLILCLILLSPIYAFGEMNVQISDTAVTKIDSVVKSLMKSKHIAGSSIAIVDHGQIPYEKGYGFSDRRKNIKASAHTNYCIGSTTKTFTAMAIMKLRDEGKIDLEKPASYYIPELKIKSLVETGEVLKIKNVLSHTSGLTDGTMNYDMCNEEHYFTSVIEDLNQEVLVHKTNWKFSYSNIGFCLLGCIIERVSGMKYETYIRTNFLDKMDMTHSGFYNHPEDTLFSKGYDKDTVETTEPILRDMPAGRLFCSVEDMAKFMIMILNNGIYNGQQIISKQALMDMETCHTNDLMLKGGSKYGYAMFMDNTPYKEDSLFGQFVGHPGDTWVYHCSCFMFPKIGVGIVVLTNTKDGSSFCNSSFTKLFAQYQKSVKGIHLHPIPPVKANATSQVNNDIQIKEIEGSYASGEDISLKMKRINDKKIVMMQDQQRIILKKQSDGNWSVTVKLLLVVPIHVKEAELGFEKVNGDIYLKQISTKNGNSRFIAVKDNPTTVSETWKNASGKYKVINACDGNIQGVPEELKIDGNKIHLKVRFDKKTVETYSFNALSDNMAAIDGIERRSGAIMKILPGGHIYFSGYEMVKQ